MSNIKDLAKQTRKNIVEMSYKGHAGHIGSALSIADILTVLYFRVLNVNPKNPKAKERDRFILSKGHACAALYSVLARKGFFPINLLSTFHKDAGLSGHSDNLEVPGIEAMTGSLGHGLPIGLGMALAGKYDKLKYRVFVLISDAECNEGEVWEAALAASHFKLDNLVVIVDYNKSQALGSTEKVMGLEPFRKKWESFGWSVEEVDGHDLKILENVFKKISFKKGKPNTIIAHTKMGAGVSFMENNFVWHYFNLSDKQYQKAVKEIAKGENK